MELIERANYFDVIEYLAYQENVLQKSPKTAKRKWAHLRHLLNWAGSTHFPRANKPAPALPTYLLTARNDRLEQPLSPASMERACREARDFFQWAKLHRAVKYRSLPAAWTETLRPAKAYAPQSQIRELSYYSLEEVEKICAIVPERLIDQRDQAGVALAFAAGLRVSALVSLPVRCVQVENLEVHQLPEAGVHTKNSKAQITYMLPIEPLLAIIAEWSTLVRVELGGEGLWYPNMSRRGAVWVISSQPASVESRRMSFSHSLKRLCQQAGVEYKSPHKLRHGHGVHIAKLSRTYSEFKAYSQNMGHETTEITERYYARLSGSDVKKVVTQAGSQVDGAALAAEEMREFREFQAYKAWLRREQR